MLWYSCRITSSPSGEAWLETTTIYLLWISVRETRVRNTDTVIILPLVI